MEDKNYLVKYASLLGLYMGFFWIFKYLFIVFGGNNEYLSALYMGFTAAVPIVAYRFTVIYREQTNKEAFSFFHAWQFGVLLYMFAAIIVSLVHLYYYKYVLGPEGVAEAMQQTLALLSSSGVNPAILKQAETLTLTPLQMTVQDILSNTMAGAIFSIPVALLAKRKTKLI